MQEQELQEGLPLTEETAEPTFESALRELETVVRKMESGETTLEESLALFQRGTELTALCAGKLDEAERRITQLVKAADGSWNEVPLERGGEDEDL